MQWNAVHLGAPFLLGFLLGSIPFGLLLTRAAGLGDHASIIGIVTSLESPVGRCTAPANAWDRYTELRLVGMMPMAVRVALMASSRSAAL